MKKIKDLETALKMYEEAAVKQEATFETGDYKTGNKYYEIFAKARNFIKKEKALEKLKPFLNHASPHLRVCAADDLLPIYEKEAIHALEEVIKDPGIVSMSAGRVLGEWKGMDMLEWLKML